MNDAEAQAVTAFTLLGDGLDARRLVERAPRLRDDLGADLRELDAALAALEYAHAELLLDVLDRGRQARLAHERALGGAAEMLLVGDGDQVFELGQMSWRRSIGFAYRSDTNKVLAAAQASR